MAILGLNGSPRKGGNTDLLLRSFFEGVASTGETGEIIDLSGLSITPCRECLSCFADGNCVIKDEMQGIYPRLLSAGGIVLSSPIFFYGVTAWAKAPVDRSQAIWARKYMLKDPSLGPEAKKRKGYFISVGGTKGEKMFEGSILTAKYFFDALNTSYDGELLFRKVDGKGDILKEPGSLELAFAEGVKFAQLVG
ncbi:MAG: flavodoxin family protein [Smithellaceae bacterium]|nr:flavodoxin family protein [Smithellaceae bacterium]